MLALGAKGVQVGTRFITTVECDADRHYKEFHLNAHPSASIIVPSPVGKTARALRNTFAEQIALDQTAQLNTVSKQPCVANCLASCLYRDTQQTYCILQALDRAARGDVENGLIFSGAHVGRAKRIMSVAAVMAELTSSHAIVTQLNDQPKALDMNVDDVLRRYASGERNFHKISLQEVDLLNAHLQGVIFDHADLRQSRLGKTDFRQASFREANLSEAILWGTNLSQADLYRAVLREADLSGAKVSHANLEQANLMKASLCGANLVGAKLSRAILFEADLRPTSDQLTDLGRAILTEADMSYANLSGAVLYKANLDGARLCRAHLNRAMQQGFLATDLSEASLQRADLSYADLSGAILRKVDLRGADLTGAILTDADLQGAIMPDGTVYSG
jgi:uncharacterized protein YjbI with pentapeptide repeats